VWTKAAITLWFQWIYLCLFRQEKFRMIWTYWPGGKCFGFLKQVYRSHDSAEIRATGTRSPVRNISETKVTLVS
jgi:hypothetical protein